MFILVVLTSGHYQGFCKMHKNDSCESSIGSILRDESQSNGNDNNMDGNARDRTYESRNITLDVPSRGIELQLGACTARSIAVTRSSTYISSLK